MRGHLALLDIVLDRNVLALDCLGVLLRRRIRAVGDHFVGEVIHAILPIPCLGLVNEIPAIRLFQLLVDVLQNCIVALVIL